MLLQTMLVRVSRLPIQLGSKVSSRLSARAIRAFLDSQPAQRANGASTSSPAASKPDMGSRAAAVPQAEKSGPKTPPTMTDLTGVRNMTSSGGTVAMQPLSNPLSSPTVDTAGTYQAAAFTEGVSFATPVGLSGTSSAEGIREASLDRGEVLVARIATVVPSRTTSDSIRSTGVAPNLAPIIDVGQGSDVEGEDDVTPSGNRRPPVRMMELAQPLDARTK